VSGVTYEQKAPPRFPGRGAASIQSPSKNARAAAAKRPSKPSNAASTMSRAAAKGTAVSSAITGAYRS
jgi:hypothetical protein